MRSVLSQSVAAQEILVVDDASDDDPRSRLAPFGDRVRYLRHETARGPGAARNTGIRESRAPILGFLDADDVWEPRMIERQLAEFSRFPDLGLSCTRLVDCDERLVPLEPTREYPARHREWVFDELYLTAFKITTSTVFTRRDAVLAAGLFSEEISFAEDYEFWLRLTMRFPLSCIPESLCRKRLHHGALTFRIDYQARIAAEMACFESCGNAAEALRIRLPMGVEDRKILCLRRRLRQTSGYGDAAGAEIYRTALAQAEHLSQGDLVAMSYFAARHRLKRSIRAFAERIRSGA